MSDTKTETRLAKVVHVAGPRYGATEVVINRGSRHGVKLKDRFLVFGYGPQVVDPDTGEDLGWIELVRGRGEVVHVQDQLATLRTIEWRRPGRGKRIVRKTPPGLLGNMFTDQVIEEELPAEENVPFEDVAIGDLAKPI